MTLVTKHIFLNDLVFKEYKKRYGEKREISKHIRKAMKIYLNKDLSEEMKEMFRINPDFGKRKTNMEISR